MTKIINFVKQLNVISKNYLVPKNIYNLSYSITRSFCDKSLKCWKCGSVQKSSVIFCEKCNVIQKPQHEDNYFKVLGLDESYDINLKDLVRRFRELQSQLHPDKYSNKYVCIQFIKKK